MSTRSQELRHFVRCAAPAVMGVASVLSAAPSADATPPGTTPSITTVSGTDPGSADRAYRAAAGMLNRGMYEPATAEYKNFLEQHPQDARVPTARYGMAVCLFKLGKADEASAELDRVLSVDDFEFAADAAMLSGRCAMRGERFQAAAEKFALVWTRHPESALVDEARALGGEAMYRSGDFAGARKTFQVFAGNSGAMRDRVEYLWSLCDAAQGQDREAVDRLRALRSRSPSGGIAAASTLAEAQGRQRLGETAEANLLYKMASESGDESVSPWALLGLGQTCRELGKLNDAAAALDRALREHAGTVIEPEARFERGRVAFDARDYVSAANCFDAVGKMRRNEAAETLAVEATYWRAECDLRMERFDAASTALGDFAMRHPNHPLVADATLDRALALFRAGKDEAAAKAMADFRGRYPDHAQVAEVVAIEASLAHRAGHFAECVTLCEAFLKAYPTHARASAVFLLRADSEYLQGRFDAASEAYEGFEQRWPKDDRITHARARRGLSLIALGRSGEGLPLLASALSSPQALDPRVLRAGRAALADAAFDRADWAAAERWLGDLLAEPTDPQSSSVHDLSTIQLRLAMCAHRQGRLSEAVQKYDALVTGGGEVALQAEFERAQALVELGELPKARAGFERVAASREETAAKFRTPARRHLAAIASREGKPADAAELLGMVASASGEASPAVVADAAFERANALMSAGKYAESREAYLTFVRQFPSDPRGFACRARGAIAASRNGQFEVAVAEFDGLGNAQERLDAGLRAAILYERAWSLKAIDRTEEARAAYTRLLSEFPDAGAAAHASVALALIELDAGRFDAAKSLVEKLLGHISAHPDKPENELREVAMYVRGVCEFRLGAWAASARALSEYTALYPTAANAASAWLMLGDSQMALSLPAEAAQSYDAAASSGGATIRPVALVKKGSALAVAQRWEPSEEAFARAIAEFPGMEGTAEVRFGIGWARENSGRTGAAIEAYRAVAPGESGVFAARAQFQIGECLFALKRYEEAVRELMKVEILYAYPEWSAAGLYEAGRCLIALGKPVEASAQFQAVIDKFASTEWSGLAAEQLKQLEPTSLPGSKIHHQEAKSVIK